MSTEYLFNFIDLSVFYEHGPALYKVCLSGLPCETIGIVGESGSGKSTLAKALIGLQKPSEGKVLFRGNDVYSMTASNQRLFRKDVQIIFQDPDASMNPRRSAVWHLLEALQIHFPSMARSEQEMQINQVLSKVQLDPSLLPRYPYELSGGQKQRIAIAKALLVRPKLIVLDEPLSSLDAALRKSTLSLLASLQQEFGVAYLFITHDLSTLGVIAKHVAVIYRGVIVEIAQTEKLYKTPLHPYTQALLSCIPVPNPRIEKTRKPIIFSSTIQPIPAHKGCVFAHRCPHATDLCLTNAPTLRLHPSGHLIACHKAP